MYASGLRHKECRCLRVKDVDFDQGHIVIRDGKGDKDRITVLPDCCVADLGRQIEAVSGASKRGNHKTCRATFVAT